MRRRCLPLIRVWGWLLVACTAICSSSPLQAQLAPEIGYLFPPGGRAGDTVDITLGGYDWTPDMQLFPHDGRIALTLNGTPSPVLVPPPPYWFGSKARGPAWSLPREFPARLAIPAGLPRGLYRWQVANANGASPVALFHVTDTPEYRDDPRATGIQTVPALPLTISGQVRLIEEIDRFQFQVDRAGPVSLELIARQLASPLHARITVTDAAGKSMLDLADTEGRDLAACFRAEANTPYILSLHDLDFAGDRSYVYRIILTPGPLVQAAYPAAGKRGETRPVEFIGRGLATGANQLESITASVAFPAAADAQSLDYRLQTPLGESPPFRLLVSDIPESVVTSSGPANSEPPLLSLPGAVTAAWRSDADDRYRLPVKKGDVWRISMQSRRMGSRLDPTLTVLSPTGQELAFIDDTPESIDPTYDFTVPADGEYQLLVGNTAGSMRDRRDQYRLAVAPISPGFDVTIPPVAPVLLGGTVKLTAKLTRRGGFAGPVQLAIASLPEGVTMPADLTIPADKAEVSWDFTCRPDAAAAASLCDITATAAIADQTVTCSVGKLLVAITMKPRIKITPEGLDDVRKVHRGSTYLAPLLIERLESYQGELVLEMTSKQQRHRQGLASDEFTVPAEAIRVEYPIFVPEWMETTKTSRMILNGAVRVPDPRGNVRTLLQRMELRIGILPEGALLKLNRTQAEWTARPGETVAIPVTLSRAAQFREEVRLELVTNDQLTGMITAEPMVVAPEQTEAILTLRIAADCPAFRARELTLRAAALQDGRWPVRTETTVRLDVLGK